MHFFCPHVIPVRNLLFQVVIQSVLAAESLCLFKSAKDKARGLVLLERASRGAPTDAQIRAHLDEARKG